MPSITAGKALLSFLGVFTIIGPFIADWNETHVLNPNWPPHARFHNGQTMTTGLMLGLCVQYFLWRPLSLSQTSSATPSYIAKQNADLALLFLHLYYLPSMSGILYPGTLWMDPEFGDGSPQVYMFSTVLALAWVGWYVEKRRIGASGHGKTA